MDLTTRVWSHAPEEIAMNVHAPAPRSWAEKAYPKLLHYDKHEKGGHFAAWEQPAALTTDRREAFRSLR